MTRIRLLMIGCVVIVAIALGAGYMAGGIIVAGLIAPLAAGLWLLAVLAGRPPAAATLGWLFCSAAAGIGVSMGLQPALMLIALVAALGAWDIIHFEQRLNAAARVDDAALLERRHLRALALVAAAGLAFSAAALLVRVDLGFGLAGGVAIAVVVLLGWITRAEA